MINRDNAVIGSMNPRQPVYPSRIVYSISDKVSEVLERLKTDGTISVATLFYESNSKTELIATLIAVLELCRVGSALMTGSEEDLAITYTGTGADPMMPDFTQED